MTSSVTCTCMVEQLTLPECFQKCASRYRTTPGVLLICGRRKRLRRWWKDTMQFYEEKGEWGRCVLHNANPNSPTFRVSNSGHLKTLCIRRSTVCHWLAFLMYAYSPRFTTKTKKWKWRQPQRVKNTRLAKLKKKSPSRPCAPHRSMVRINHLLCMNPSPPFCSCQFSWCVEVHAQC